jgi:flagellar hook-basal body complex protein FliE
VSAEIIAALSAVQAPIIEPKFQVMESTQVGSTSGVIDQKSGFGDLIVQGLSQVNEQLMINQSDLQQLAVGDVQNLHQIMIRMEESRLSFQLLMQVRSRALEAYQDVMKMQV